MRIRIEVDEHIQDDEVIIKCKSLSKEVLDIQNSINEVLSRRDKIIFYKGETEYYFPMENVLFFETETSGISAHTVDDLYTVKYKLYELEEILPGHFTRVSKSTILNINYIYSISRNLTSSSLVKFKNTHKQVYVSRYYYKPLKIKLLEKRS